MSHESFIRILLVGPNGSGKTSICHQLRRQTFDVDDLQIREDFSFQHGIIVDDDVCMLHIQDIHFTGECSAMHDLYRKRAHAFMLVYDITSTKSFDNILCEWRQVLRIHDKDSMPGILVGCKSDLIHERQVEFCVAEEMAQKMGIMAIEVSAKENHAITEAFEQLVVHRKNIQVGQENSRKRCYIS